MFLNDLQFLLCSWHNIMSWWGNYYEKLLREDTAAFEEMSARIQSVGTPEEAREIRREYYDTRRPVALTDMVPWSKDDTPEPQGLPQPEQWAAWERFPVSEVLNAKVYCFQGDITSIETDAIVNAANNSLLGGGGVDGAIHKAAGRLLEEECRGLHGCENGDAKITRGYFLPADYVIHTVGPFGASEKGNAVLESCYLRCLDVMKANGLRTIAFCGISTGIYGFPLVRATHIALLTIRKWLEANPDAVDAVVFCQFLDKEYLCYRKVMHAYFPKTEVDAPAESEVAKVTNALSDGARDPTNAAVPEVKNDATVSGTSDPSDVSVMDHPTNTVDEAEGVAVDASTVQESHE